MPVDHKVNELFIPVIYGHHIGHVYGELVRIVKHYYDEPHRAYHGWNHIVQGAKLANELAQHSEDFHLTLAQQLAWLFHDIVYVPGTPKGRNESMSAALLETIMQNPHLLQKNRKEGLGDAVNMAYHLILDTIHHRPSNEQSKAVLDIDLASFRDTESFEQSSQLLKVEFGKTSDSDFQSGHKQFLRNFIETRSSIYSTEWCKYNWEDSAQKIIRDYVD